ARARQGVVLELLLQQPGRQVAAEFSGALLTLAEGLKSAGRVGMEQKVEGRGGMGKETLTQLFARVWRRGGGRVHERSSGSGCSVLPPSPIILATSPRRNYLHATSDREKVVGPPEARYDLERFAVGCSG